jgi:hypothetical protein
LYSQRNYRLREGKIPKKSRCFQAGRTLVPLHVVRIKLRMPPSENPMKRLMVLTLLFLLTTLPVFGRGSHSHYSTRSITACNGTQRDNFSTKGNVNPYTGKVGTKKATH